MSKELDLAVTVIALVQLTKLTSRLIEEVRIKEAWKQRDDEDKKNFSQLMDIYSSVGHKLMANMQRLAKED